MRILYDAFELAPGQGKSIGIYNYARNLVAALLEVLDENDHLVVLCNVHNAVDFVHSSSRLRTVVVPERLPRKVERQLWSFGRAAWWVRRLQGDVYLSPKGFLPRFTGTFASGSRTVVVVHDLIPLWYAEHFPRAVGRVERQVVNRALVYSVRSADRIVAVSRATADDIAARLGRTSGVDVVHNGVATAPAGVPARHGAYIFAITSSLPHKNAGGLLDAYGRYRRMVEAPLPLVVCGLPATQSPGVFAVRDLDDATLHSYYAHASLFLFLSLTEGFGFPPVEALSHGTPVVCSDIPALTEVTRGLAEYVPPSDADAMAKQIVDSLRTDRAPEDDRRRAAIVHEYDWRECARGILGVMRS